MTKKEEFQLWIGTEFIAFENDCFVMRDIDDSPSYTFKQLKALFFRFSIM